MEHASSSSMGREREKQHYKRLGLMLGLSFVAMYTLMYAMVDIFGNVYGSLNQAYMAALMTSPMAIFEILLMGMMYPNRRRNALIVGASVIVFIFAWMFIRQQVAIGDRQFLRSMISHHAGALLMCEEASLEDREVKALCRTILTGQQAEIDQMKRILKRLDQ